MHENQYVFDIIEGETGFLIQYYIKESQQYSLVSKMV